MDLGGGVTHTIRMYLNSEMEIIERARMRFFIAGWNGKRESDIVRLERLVDCFPHEHARTRARTRTDRRSACFGGFSDATAARRRRSCAPLRAGEKRRAGEGDQKKEGDGRKEG